LIAQQIGSAQIRSSADRISADQFGRSVERPDFPRIVDCLSPQILDQTLPLTAEGDFAPILALDGEALGVMPCSVR
jgi:hypothetical protein